MIRNLIKIFFYWQPKQKSMYKFYKIIFIIKNKKKRKKFRKHAWNSFYFYLIFLLSKHVKIIIKIFMSSHFIAFLFLMKLFFHLHHFYTNQTYPCVITNHELQRKAYTLARIPKKVLRNLGRLTLEYEMWIHTWSDST